MNKIYKNILILSISSITRISRDSHISINKLYLYNLEKKYKRYYSFNYLIQINSIDEINSKKVKYRLSTKYYNYLDIFNRTKADILFLYYSYNYKLEFNDNFDKTKLSKSKIYLILEYKLKQIKKYLNEYLKKGFIISSYILFTLSILFAKKLNKELYFLYKLLEAKRYY